MCLLLSSSWPHLEPPRHPKIAQTEPDNANGETAHKKLWIVKGNHTELDLFPRNPAGEEQSRKYVFSIAARCVKHIVNMED